MNNLRILLRNNLNILIGAIRGKTKKRSALSAIMLLVCGAVLLAIIYTLQTISMYDGLGFGKLCMFHACVTTVSVLGIIGITRSTTNQSKDNDFLLSMPIKKTDIILSKSVNKYLFDLFFIAILFVPYLIVYQFKCGLDLSVLLMGILLTLLLPLFSVGISYIADYIINRLYRKSRYSSILKSLTIVLLYVIVLGLLLLKTSLYGTVTFESMEDYFADRFVSNMLLKFMFEINFVNVVLVLLFVLVPFVIGVLLYAKNFGKTISGYVSKNKELSFHDTRSSLGLFYKKELSYYLTTTAYVVNTIIGPIIGIALTIFLCITGNSGLTTLLGMEVPTGYLFGIIILVLCGLSATTYISSCSISLEGKGLWILRSLPINVGNVLLSKVLVHITIIEPVIIISSIMISIAFKLSLIYFLLLLALPTLHVLIMSISGVLINLWLPNFDWDNETKVVKQSLPSLLGLIIGMILTVIPFGIFKLFAGMTLINVALITLGVYLILTIIVSILLITLGKKLFYKL